MRCSNEPIIATSLHFSVGLGALNYWHFNQSNPLLDRTRLSLSLRFDPLPQPEAPKDTNKEWQPQRKINEGKIFCSEDVGTQPSIAGHSTNPSAQYCC